MLCETEIPLLEGLCVVSLTPRPEGKKVVESHIHGRDIYLVSEGISQRDTGLFRHSQETVEIQADTILALSISLLARVGKFL